MTREEAIKTLRELWRETNDSWYEEVYDMAIEALSAEVVHKPDYSYEADIVRRIKEALSTEVVDVEGCDGCKYNTRIPQKQCLCCSRYWRDNYEYKDGDDE